MAKKKKKIGRRLLKLPSKLLKWIVIGFLLGVVFTLGMQKPKTTPLSDHKKNTYGVIANVKVGALPTQDKQSFTTSDGYLILTRHDLSPDIKVGDDVMVFGSELLVSEKKVIKSWVFKSNPVWLKQVMAWFVKIWYLLQDLIVDMFVTLWYFFKSSV